jgi:hypothetical protein
MTVARPRRRYSEFRIDGVLGRIDADRPDVAAGKFPALAGAPQPNRPRPVYTLAAIAASIEIKV